MKHREHWAIAGGLSLALGCGNQIRDEGAAGGARARLPLGFQRGISLGNRLDAPKEGDWGPPLRKSDFATIAQRGFDHVRLPVRFSAHALTQSPFTLDGPFMQRVDWAMQAARAQGLSVVLDFQYYDELLSEPAAHRQRFLGIWEQLSWRYRTQSEGLAFELLSNPSGALSESYEALVREAVSTIRRNDKTRLVIVDGLDSARPGALAALPLPDDAHLVASAHLFGPELFTLQGVPWLTPEYLTTGVVFPGPPAEPLVPVDAAQVDDAARAWFEQYNALPSEQNPCGPNVIHDTIASLLEFRSQSGYDVYVGELGTSVFGDIASRSRYLELLRSRLEAESLGWAVWDNNGNDLAVLGREEGTFYDATIDALLPP